MSWLRLTHTRGPWDEVKDKLKESGLSLSGGQQRDSASPVRSPPSDVILLDEPASALDPISPLRSRNFCANSTEYTIIIVAQHAAGSPRERQNLLLTQRAAPGRWLNTVPPARCSPTRTRALKAVSGRRIMVFST